MKITSPSFSPPPLLLMLAQLFAPTPTPLIQDCQLLYQLVTEVQGSRSLLAPGTSTVTQEAMQVDGGILLLLLSLYVPSQPHRAGPASGC